MYKSPMISPYPRRSVQTQQSGFTLIELMVSLMIFVIVVLAAVSSLYMVNKSSKKVEAMRSVLDNLNFAVESMSRNIRTGTDLVCGGTLREQINQKTVDHNCPFGVSYQDRLLVKSTIGSTRWIEYGVANGRLLRRVHDGIGWSNWVAITANEITIKTMKIHVQGANENDGMQPSVILFIQGEAYTGTENVAPFSIQTYISQRTLE